MIFSNQNKKIGLLNLIPNIPNIYLLTLTNCSTVTDSVIEQLALCCPNLSGLDIGGCKNVTDKALNELAKLNNLLWLTVSKTNVIIMKKNVFNNLNYFFI